MEPIINPMIFYWISLLSNIRIVSCILLALSCVFVFSTLVVFYTERGNISEILDLKYMKLIITIFIVSLFLLIFLPDKITLTEIVISRYVTPNNLEVIFQKIVECANSIS